MPISSDNIDPTRLSGAAQTQQNFGPYSSSPIPRLNKDAADKSNKKS